MVTGTHSIVAASNAIEHLGMKQHVRSKDTPETTAQLLEQLKMQFKESNETSPLSLYKDS
jgi:hypothetical protein